MVRRFPGVLIFDSTTRCSPKIKQGRCDVQPHRRRLRNPSYAQGPHQCSRGSRGRYSSPLDYVDWASVTCAQTFDWYMEIALPTGDIMKHSYSTRAWC